MNKKNLEKKFVNQKKEKWGLISSNWLRLLPPAYPSKGDMKIYSSIADTYLKNRKNSKIVILGSTPELRDLLFKYSKKNNAQIYCLDITEAMFYAMSILVKNKNKREKFVKGNWLEIDKIFKEKSIDLIIGDHVISNVGGFEDKFFSGIKKALKDDGLFITRAHFTDSNVGKVDSALKHLQKYTKRVEDKKLSIKQAYNFFGMSLLFASWYKNKKNNISLLYYSEELNKMTDDLRFWKNKTQKKIFSNFLTVWSGMMKNTWTNLPKNKLFNKIEDYYSIKNYFYSVGHEQAKNSIIFVLEKR